MNKHSSDALIAALRDLDPAPEIVLTKGERQQAEDRFARIINAPSDEPSLVELDRRRPRWRLLAPIGLVAAAGAAIVVPFLVGGSAFASWTATPEPLTPAQAAAAAATCRDALMGSASEGAVLVAERRGEWTYVLLTDQGGEGSCVMRNDVVGQDTRGREISGHYNSTDPSTAPPVARDGIVETSSMTNSTNERWSANDWLTWTEGYVGSEVAGVTVHTPIGVDVEASVDNGRFVAWWPSAKPSSENLEVMGAWSYTVTLVDGSTRKTTS